MSFLPETYKTNNAPAMLLWVRLAMPTLKSAFCPLEHDLIGHNISVASGTDALSFQIARDVHAELLGLIMYRVERTCVAACPTKIKRSMHELSQAFFCRTRKP